MDEIVYESNILWHMPHSCVMCPMSSVMCHVSQFNQTIYIYIYIFSFFILCGGNSWSRVWYQRGHPPTPPSFIELLGKYCNAEAKLILEWIKDLISKIYLFIFVVLVSLQKTSFICSDNWVPEYISCTLRPWGHPI